LVSALLASSTASGQPAGEQPAQGFALNRFNPAERGSEWFVADALDMRGHLRYAFGLTVDYAHRPLAIYTSQGDERVALVSDQLFLHLGSSLVLWERVRVGFNMPLALVNAGDDGTAEGFSVTAPSGVAPGDLRLGADVRLLGAYGDPFTAALGVQVFLPTGSQESFTGDGKIRLLPRLSAAGTLGLFTYGASLGVQYRANDEGFAGKETGTEFLGSVSAGVRALDGKLVAGPELHGSTVIASSVEAPKPSKSPLELLIGAHYTAGQLRFGAGAGPGLTRGLGAPTVRVLASVEWVAPADPDTDGDGIVDKQDACVTVPGVADPDPSKHGCPPDRDGDKIADKDDACVTVPGVADKDPKKHGCPGDRDGDRIYDRDDACPEVAGVLSQDPKLHGCLVDQDTSAEVLLDQDGDGVHDDVDKCVTVPGLKAAPASVPPARKAEWETNFLGCPEDIDQDAIPNIPDACPREKGKPDKDPKRHGCPLAVVRGCEIKIHDRVFFKTQSEVIETAGARGKTTQEVLQAVLQLLKDNPQLQQIEVQGHASQDAYARNQELSEKRAASVVKWLISKGVEPTRVVAKGYGTSRPAAGVPVDRRNKELHQRVEFHIAECKEEKAK
jgi:outer membrane protein OmpA-like peptidoglycan-associated protein